MRIAPLSPFLLLPGLAAAQPAPSPPPTTVFAPEEIPGRPVHGGTATQRVLLADGEGGPPRAALVEIARGSRVPPHGHGADYLVVIVVVRGPVHYADGARFDEAALRPHPAGSILAVPRGNLHYLEARDGDALLLAMPTRREALPAALAARLPPR